MPVIIAIDGYSSCGKSTLARQLAQSLQYTYIDSGAMYRAFTHYCLRHGITTANLPAIEQALLVAKVTFGSGGNIGKVYLNGQDVSTAIRSLAVSNNASKLSALLPVRKAMVQQQQAFGKVQNVVMDGRDIGTHVFPKAQLKIFMTASPLIRAERRQKELLAAGEQLSVDEVLMHLHQRDLQDTTRKESPLVQADDAILLDNSALNPAEQLAFVQNLTEQKLR